MLDHGRRPRDVCRLGVGVLLFVGLRNDDHPRCAHGHPSAQVEAHCKKPQQAAAGHTDDDVPRGVGRVQNARHDE